MTDQPETTPDDEAEARTAWLHSLTVDQITRFDTGTILDWLDARREQHIVRLRAACQLLREQITRSERAHERLAAAVSGVER